MRNCSARVGTHQDISQRSIRASPDDSNVPLSVTVATTLSQEAERPQIAPPISFAKSGRQSSRQIKPASGRVISANDAARNRFGQSRTDPVDGFLVELHPAGEDAPTGVATPDRLTVLGGRELLLDRLEHCARRCARTDERWNHAQRGWLEPSELVPIASTTGMIEQIDQFVLATAARDVASWRADHRGLVAWITVPQLARLRPDAVKLDRGFVRQPGADVESAKAVRSLVGMIRPLGITIVAKGVDTHEQLAAVLALNCDAAQGAMISQPTPAAELEFVRRAIDAPETHAPESHAVAL